MYIRFFKRALDIFFVLIIIGLFSWLLLLIALIYVIQFQFPLLFKQERIGKNNSSFTIYKFRTLKVSENLDLNKRRFWWGDVLHFFSLDEFPQLFNVLRGEMSLIGPRPLPAEYLPLMNEQQRE